MPWGYNINNYYIPENIKNNFLPNFEFFSHFPSLICREQPKWEKRLKSFSRDIIIKHLSTTYWYFSTFFPVVYDVIFIYIIHPTLPEIVSNSKSADVLAIEFRDFVYMAFSVIFRLFCLSVQQIFGKFGRLSQQFLSQKHKKKTFWPICFPIDEFLPPPRKSNPRILLWMAQTLARLESRALPRNVVFPGLIKLRAFVELEEVKQWRISTIHTNLFIWSVDQSNPDISKWVNNDYIV